MPPDLVPVDELRSSGIGAVAHDPKTNTLHVQYRGGDKVYDYPGITAQDHKELMAAPSMGRHLQSVIAPKSKAAAKR